MNTINIDSGDMGLVVGFVLMLGYIIKTYTPIKNELIPLITWALGGLLYQWLSGGWTDPRQWMMALLSVAGATGLHSATKSTIELKGKPPTPTSLILLLLLPAGLVLTGCAHFTTTQTDIRYDENGKIATAVTTRATASTLFEAESALANFKATQTDKTQSASVGQLNQSSSATNSITALADLIRALGALR